MTLADGWDGTFRVADGRERPFVEIEPAALTALADAVPRVVLPTARSVYLALCELARTGERTSVAGVVAIAAVSKRTAYERLREIERSGLAIRRPVADSAGGSAPSVWVLMDASPHNGVSNHCQGGLATVAKGGLATIASLAHAQVHSGPSRSTEDVAGRQLSVGSYSEEEGPPTPTPSPWPIDASGNDLTTPDAVDAVFNAWLVAAQKNAATKLTADRRRLIERALRSHGLETCLDAVRGWRHSSFHCGENDRNKPYNDIGLLLRDARHIEEFAELERNPPPLVSGRGDAFRRTAEQLRGAPL